MKPKLSSTSVYSATMKTVANSRSPKNIQTKNDAKIAILFDMDGVLIDTVGINWQANNAILKQDYGIEITKNELHRYLGIATKEQLEMISDDYDIDIDINSFITKTNLFKNNNLKPTQAMQGVKTLLNELHNNNIPVAVGTSTDRDVAKQRLKSAGLLEYFEIIIAGDDVSRHKPEPDVYLECAKQLGVEARQCVVIEDAPAGIRSAHAASMKCLAVKTIFTSTEQLDEADMLVDSLDNVNISTLRSLLNQDIAKVNQ